MKKSIIFAAILGCMTVCGQHAWAQTSKSAGKMSAWLCQQYRQQQEAVAKNGGALRVQGRPVVNYILTLVESSDQAATVRQKGGVVWQDFGRGVSAAFLPIDSLDALGQSDAVLRMEANAMSVAHNDTAAVITGVEKIWLTEDESLHAFTGKGVFAGVMDVGFDFTHPAFRNADGTSRIKWFWDPMVPNANDDALGMFYSSPEQVLAARHSSDAEDASHGSHVMGSMAGIGLAGCYGGMAPEADIIGARMPLGQITEKDLKPFKEYIDRHFGTDLLMDEAILQVELSNTAELVELYKLFQTADAAGQPCVVNWSFGSQTSFIQDNRLYQQVFNSLVGPGHIVVTSAGNNGGYKTYLKKEADNPLKTEVYFIGSTKYAIQFRNATGNPEFVFKLSINGLDTPFVVDSRKVKEAESRAEVYEDFILLPQPANWDEATMGKYVAAQHPFKITCLPIKGAEGRPCYYMEVLPSDVFEKAKAMSGSIEMDTPIEMEMTNGSQPGVIVEFALTDPTVDRGCNKVTIGAPANLERIITVGAMHQRSSFLNVLGQSASYNSPGSQEGHLASFSSCGPTTDGLIKPDVVAPGHNIISALNSYYMKNFNGNQEAASGIEPLRAFTYEQFGREYGMWAMSGSSMSSPIVAGIIALWLQAKPTLTPEDIMGVIERTSHQPEPEFSGTDKNVYYGWGEIDAYAGLLDVLGLPTSIPGLSMHQPAGITFRLSGRTFCIDGLDGATPVTIYNLSGQPVLRTVCTDGTVALPNLPAGVYAVQVDQKGSTLIRL